MTTASTRCTPSTQTISAFVILLMPVYIWLRRQPSPAAGGIFAGALLFAIVHAAAPGVPVPYVSAVVDLQQDAGAWTGLTLWDGEADYREVALYWRHDGLRVGWWAPCYWRDIAPVPPGARALRLTYAPPPASTCWTAHVDDALVHTESCTHAGAPLVGPPHAGLWVVNLDAEAQRTSAGRVRASVGRVLVEQLKRP